MTTRQTITMMSVAVLPARVVPCVAGQDAPALKGNLEPADDFMAFREKNWMAPKAIASSGTARFRDGCFATMPETILHEALFWPA